MIEPGAAEAYQAAFLAYDLGDTVRMLREQRGIRQSRLGRAAGLTQSALARFETGGITPTVPVLDRLARALDAELVVRFEPHGDPATQWESGQERA